MVTRLRSPAAGRRSKPTPPIDTLPASGRRSPASRSTSVDLPTPLGPTIARWVPAAMSRSRCSTIGSAPSAWAKLTSVARSAGGSGKHDGPAVLGRRLRHLPLDVAQQDAQLDDRGRHRVGRAAHGRLEAARDVDDRPQQTADGEPAVLDQPRRGGEQEQQRQVPADPAERAAQRAGAGERPAGIGPPVDHPRRRRTAPGPGRRRRRCRASPRRRSSRSPRAPRRRAAGGASAWPASARLRRRRRA